MGDHHQGDSLLVQFIKQFQHFSRGVRVKGAGGFVRQEKTRAIDDRFAMATRCWPLRAGWDDCQDVDSGRSRAEAARSLRSSSGIPA